MDHVLDASVIAQGRTPDWSVPKLELPTKRAATESVPQGLSQQPLHWTMISLSQELLHLRSIRFI